MKIVHLCLSCFYNDGYTYQENELARRHVLDGHDVSIIASTEVFDEAMQISYTKPSQYVGNEGAAVTRLAYWQWAPEKIMRKIRAYKGLRGRLESESPDVIVCHGISGAWLVEVARFKRQNPEVIIFADNHADFNNSALGFISRNLLHRGLYRYIVRHSLWAIEAVLCVSTEAMDFAGQMYDIPSGKTEFFPLGGEVFDDKEYFSRRTRCREKLGASHQHVVFVQSGKFEVRKKLIEAVAAFSGATTNPNFMYVIAGHVPDELLQPLDELISADSRVIYIGWKSADDLKDLLCAADIYSQPGTQSATMQMSLSARCPVIIANVKAHKPFFFGNGWLVSSQDEIVAAMRAIERDPSALAEMSVQSHEIAKRLLDYRQLAARFYRN